MGIWDIDGQRITERWKINDLIHITVDDRESKSKVIMSLSEIDNVAINIQRLSIGDYQIGKCVIVERKALKDFAQSIVDGRLFRQMTRLAKSKFMGVVIIEGTAVDTINLGITRASIQGALITISIILGIPILRSKDPLETAKLICYIGNQIKSMIRGSIQRHGYRPKSKRRTQLYILQGLPGVGPERASRLLDSFGSVEATISATSSELQSVEGIGKVIADKIKWAVSKDVYP